MTGITPAVRVILILNIIVYIADVLLSQGSKYSLFADLFGLRSYMAETFRPYQLLTYMFVHSLDIFHILFNMLAVYMFGTWLENIFGTRRFMSFYMICGIGAGLIHAGVTFTENYFQKEALQKYVSDANPDHFVKYISRYEKAYYRNELNFVNAYAESPKNQAYIQQSIAHSNELMRLRSNVPTIGASGAVFGILVAFALIFPNVELFLLFFPIPIKAKYLVGFYILYELYAGFRYEVSNVAHFAHLGGALIGFLLIRFWKIQRHY